MAKTTTSIISVPLFGVPVFSNLQRVSGDGGAAALSSSGAFSFDTLNDFDGLAVGETAELKFSYTATAVDGSSTGEINVTVEGDTSSQSAQMTGAEIKAAYEAEDDTNALTDQLLDRIGKIGSNGWIDYNHSDHTPVTVPANTWHTILNDGLGPFSNDAYPPEGVNSVMNNTTGALDLTQLSIGDDIQIRNDYVVIPSINGAILELRYTLGTGAGAYTLPRAPRRLYRGAGQEEREALLTDYIYVGDSNTRDNPVYIQVKCSAQFDFFSYGLVAKITRRRF